MKTHTFIDKYFETIELPEKVIIDIVKYIMRVDPAYIHDILYNELHLDIEDFIK